MCKGVSEQGDVAIKFCKGGEFDREGEGEACEIGGCEEERVTMKAEDFLHDNGRSEVEGEGNRVGDLCGKVGAN